MLSDLVRLIQLASNPAVLTGREGLLIEGEEDKSEVSWSALKLPAIATLLSLLAGPLGLSISPILVGGAIAIASLPVAKRACESVIAERRLNVDFLDFAAIARHAQKIISQNTKIVAIPNLSGLALAATVGINPMTATLINNGFSVIAGANGLRPALRKDLGKEL
jgi:cation transport ATPase